MTTAQFTAGGLPPVLLLAMAGATAAGCGSTNAADAGAGTGAAGAVQCVVSSSTQPTCPTPAPSYAAKVKDIIDTNCQACHASGGIGAVASGPGRSVDGDSQSKAADPAADGPPADPAGPAANPNRPRPANFDPDSAHDWSVLANIRRSATKMMQMLFLCEMPPADASALSAEDRTTLASWLKCGAPDN